MTFSGNIDSQRVGEDLKLAAGFVNLSLLVVLAMGTVVLGLSHLYSTHVRGIAKSYCESTKVGETLDQAFLRASDSGMDLILLVASKDEDSDVFKSPLPKNASSVRSADGEMTVVRSLLTLDTFTCKFEFKDRKVQRVHELLE